MNKLTIIIPFLNEGKEVENTVRNIRYTAEDKVNILLINDHSTDNFNYKEIAQKYQTEYIVNKERKGVALCRDVGVSAISTPFFMLLDAHMRFYQPDWWKIAIDSLEKDDRAVYCFTSLPLDQHGNKTDLQAGFGAYIHFFGNKFTTLLEPDWITTCNTNQSIYQIPCVLGASYSMSKRYWNYIKGLSLLRYYGADEAYLSLKVWLEGGSCKLISQIKAGHIFRKKPPFDIIKADSLYNKLLIANTILPEEYIHYIHANMQRMFPHDYWLAVSLLNRKSKEIQKLKIYYQQIFTRDFAFIKKLNAGFRPKQVVNIKTTRSLPNMNFTSGKIKEIAHELMQHPTSTTGLLSGELGELIFLAEYAKIASENKIKDYITERVNHLLESNITHCNLSTGAAGLGIGLHILKEKVGLDIDPDELFEEMDQKLYNQMITDITNNRYEILTGATGIAISFLIRKSSSYLSHIKELMIALENYTNQQSLTTEQTTIHSCSWENNLSIVQFLLFTYKQGILKKEILPILEKQTDFILSQIQDPKQQGSWFSENWEKSDKSGLGCNCGDLITGYLLWQSASVLKENALMGKSLEILISTTKRRDPVQEQVYDAGFYLGSSGITYLYHLLYLQTNNNLFAEAAKYWQEETFYKACYEANAGYIAYNRTDFNENRGLLYGIAGIGLVLLSLNHPTEVAGKTLLFV